MIGPSRVWHWYDFACPYSYVAQDRNAGFRRLGLCPDLLPYSVRTKTGRSAALGEARDGPTPSWRGRLARPGLPALAKSGDGHSRRAPRGEWSAPVQPDRFELLHLGIRRAFRWVKTSATSNDLLADQAGVDIAGVRAAMADGTAEAAVVVSESAAKRRGITGPPAWLIGDRVIMGIDSPALRSICVTPVTTSHGSDVRR